VVAEADDGTVVVVPGTVVVLVGARRGITTGGGVTGIVGLVWPATAGTDWTRGKTLITGAPLVSSA
jgi:hypothetical protein